MSASVKWLPMHQGFSPRPLLIAANAACTRLRCRSIQACERCASLRPVQTFSMRASKAASSTPSASASQVRTSMRSRPAGGMSLPTGDSVSRYSTMTRESKTASPPSMIRQGTLPSGLDLSTSSLAHTSASVSWKSSFFSAITMRTLRT